MLSKRIIPCLDIRKGKVVKGKNFVNLEIVGDAVDLAKSYYKNGADELVFLNIFPNETSIGDIVLLLRKVSKEVFIPIVYGGGVSCIDNIKKILNAGADKVSINSAAVKNPNLIYESSQIFGSQCIVVGIDVMKKNDGWEVVIESGKKKANLDALEWIKEVERLGAGEILLTSIDRDGTKKGYDLELLSLVCNTVNIPVIASGGAGNFKDILDVFKIANVDGALAASIFHYDNSSIKELKQMLYDNEIKVRIE